MIWSIYFFFFKLMYDSEETSLKPSGQKVLLNFNCGSTETRIEELYYMKFMSS